MKCRVVINNVQTKAKDCPDGGIERTIEFKASVQHNSLTNRFLTNNSGIPLSMSLEPVQAEMSDKKIGVDEGE